MLSGEWPQPSGCFKCSSKLYKKAEFLENLPPMRVYTCEKGHENIVYMTNIQLENIRNDRENQAETGLGVERRFRG